MEGANRSRKMKGRIVMNEKDVFWKKTRFIIVFKRIKEWKKIVGLRIEILNVSLEKYMNKGISEEISQNE